MYPATEKFHFTREQILDEEYEIRAAMKDISCFSPLYDRYYVRLFRYIYRRVESEDNAADITSQVFLKAMLNLNKYQFRGVPFASWLYRIASNEIAGEFRSNIICREFNTTTENLNQFAEEIDENANEMIQNLQNAMSTLSMGEMELIELRYFEKRSGLAISEITGLTESNVKVKLHRIVQKLKDKIKNVRS